MTDKRGDELIRARITELRIKKNVSEHQMSFDLNKSGSYIRSITSGTALPSLKALFRIIAYFDLTPAEFFAPMEDGGTTYQKLCTRLRDFDDDDLEKVDLFLDWMA